MCEEGLWGVVDPHEFASKNDRVRLVRFPCDAHPFSRPNRFRSPVAPAAHCSLTRPPNLLPTCPAWADPTTPPPRSLQICELNPWTR